MLRLFFKKLFSEAFMKSSIIFMILFVLSVSPLSAQPSMIADIQQPVNTPFGEYIPVPVNIDANVAPYAVTTDLSNVQNAGNFNFSSSERALLAANHFVVVPRRNDLVNNSDAYNEMFDLYNECREQGVPIFVTSDAMLHTFHQTFDFILRTIEQKRFIADLANLLQALIDRTRIQQHAASSPDVLAALEVNLNFLYVAATLLTPEFQPNDASQAYVEELQLIHAAADFANSPIFSYPEDYTQYIARGHYTKSDSLTHYFHSMMWLGRMTFACDEATKPQCRLMTRAALLLVQAMYQTQVSGEPALTVWERIYNPTVFFVGKSDDINFYQYDTLAKQVYGAALETLSPDALTDCASLDQFLSQCQTLPHQQIDYPGQPILGFRFMGQRFVPDSWVLSELVFAKVADFRLMPKGLDVMAVLGSQRADQLLTAIGEKAQYPSYAIKLDSLKATFRKYPDEQWAENVYWNWLYCLMPLLYPKGDGFPMFMQTSAWVDKDVFAALGSWSELRHDTILYVKQSGTTTGESPTSSLVQGYVEPNPYLYARLAALSDFFLTGLGKYHLIFGEFENTLQSLRTLSLSLTDIAVKELTNESLSFGDYHTIVNIGRELESIAEFSPYPNGPRPGDETKMPLVADVHTDPNTGTCLEEGVGYPFSIYVICPIEGQLVITKGAGYSHYEFTQPISQRLTDEKWLEQLTTGNEPPLAAWSSSFIDLSITHTAADALSYYCDQQGFSALYATVAVENVNTASRATITIHLDPWDIRSVNLAIEYQGEIVAEYNYITGSSYIITTEFQPEKTGQYYACVSYQGNTYRTGFYISSVDDVVEQNTTATPTQFALQQNYPNPFNPSTTIRYSIVESGPVSIAVYNPLGEHIRTLVARHHQPGEYSICWDGTDQRGKQVSSGVYIYRMQAGAIHYTRKLALMF
jgi:hypothetical protein